MIIMIVFGLLAAIVGPSIFSNPSLIIIFPFVLLAVGLACLTIAKIFLYKKGIWVSFGIGSMTNGYAKLYKVGYLLLGVGTLLLLALFNALRRT